MEFIQQQNVILAWAEMVVIDHQQKMEKLENLKQPWQEIELAISDLTEINSKHSGHSLVKYNSDIRFDQARVRIRRNSWSTFYRVATSLSAPGALEEDYGAVITNDVEYTMENVKAYFGKLLNDPWYFFRDTVWTALRELEIDPNTIRQVSDIPSRIKIVPSGYDWSHRMVTNIVTCINASLYASALPPTLATFVVDNLRRNNQDHTVHGWTIRSYKNGNVTLTLDHDAKEGIFAVINVLTADALLA